jgi:hypothetical protein
MILSLGINKVAKQVSSQDFRDGLKSLRELANQAGAEDKAGSMSASIQIFLIAITISGLLYYVTLQIFPNNLKNYLREQDNRFKKLSEQAQNVEKPNERDIIDIILDIAKRAGLFGGFAGGTVYYYKKKRKAARQRAMELAMEEEMDRLKSQLEEELNETTSAAGVVNNKSSILSGANIVELFNSFADIMAIQNNLPRDEDETALEYFEKVAESINFPKSESLKAAVYFDDELYGKKNSTKEDKAAFMKLILEMISKINKSSASAAKK